MAKKKITKKATRRVAKKASSTRNKGVVGKAREIAWKFPKNDLIFLKVETFTLAIFSVIIFILAFVERTIITALIATVAFIALYTIIAHLINKIRKAQDHYKVSKTHLHIKRVSRNKTKVKKIALKNIKKHKFDRFFLGGYVVTENERHPLFFNNLKELIAFEKHLKKHMKS
jgi:hypothetical protein